MVNDWYGGQAIVDPVSDGLIEFELLPAGNYVVRFNYGGATPVNLPVAVSVGVASYLEGDGCN